MADILGGGYHRQLKKGLLMALLSLLFIGYLFNFLCACHIRLLIDCAPDIRTDLVRGQSSFVQILVHHLCS